MVSAASILQTIEGSMLPLPSNTQRFPCLPVHMVSAASIQTIEGSMLPLPSNTLRFPCLPVRRFNASPAIQYSTLPLPAYPFCLCCFHPDHRRLNASPAIQYSTLPLPAYLPPFHMVSAASITKNNFIWTKENENFCKFCLKRIIYLEILFLLHHHHPHRSIFQDNHYNILLFVSF